MGRNPMSPELRAKARHIALDALSLKAKLSSGRTALGTPRVHNLYLHEVPPSEEQRFRELLTWLRLTGHTFIPYSEGIERCATGDVDRSYITFSFDDGFASNLSASTILQEFDTVGCFFVVTDFIGATDLTRARAVLGKGITEPAMSWSDLERMRAHGHEIGNHTRRHRNLARLTADEAADEILSARDVLVDRFGSVEHFAWPLGRWMHISEVAKDIAQAAHVSVTSAERGAHGNSETADWCPRRDHIMTNWPLRHMQYFIIRSAQTAKEAKSWPQLPVAQ